jgi:hypothetical protein
MNQDLTMKLVIDEGVFQKNFGVPPPCKIARQALVNPTETCVTKSCDGFFTDDNQNGIVIDVQV